MKKIVSLVVISLAACSGSKPAPESERPAAEQKAEAPVDVALRASALTGTSTLALDVNAKSDVNRVVARFVVPAGVKVSSGALEQDLGAMRAGESKHAEIVVEITAGATGDLMAGVDVYPAGNIKQHRSAMPVALAPAPKTDTGKVTSVDGQNVRMGEAAPAK